MDPEKKDKPKKQDAYERFMEREYPNYGDE